MTNGRTTAVEFDWSDYRSFIRRFRAAVGIGGPIASNAAEVEVQVQRSGQRGPGFRFNVHDVYMTAVRRGSTWQPIIRENYAQMGISSTYEIDGNQIEQACFFAPSTSGPLLAVSILTIAEAARSQVVYQVLQQILQSRARSAKWIEIVPLLRVWGEFTTDHHKRKPKLYGALGVRDYYEDAGAKGAVLALQQRGFAIDA